MRDSCRQRGSLAAVAFALSFAASGSLLGLESEPIKSVRAWVQTKPGGEPEDVEMPVYEALVDPASVTADSASLEDDDLVLGIEVDGQAMAYPIRYVALFEVVDDRVGDTPLAATW